MRKPVSRLLPCVLLSVATMACPNSSPPPHPAIGAWRGAALTVHVHPDHIAIVNSFRCRWVEIDSSSIRIDPPLVESDNWFIQLLRNVAAELRVRQEKKSALLVLPGLPGMEWQLERDEAPR